MTSHGLSGQAELADADRDLIVLCHLRWDWVWQRPQHLISRMAAKRRHTWFVEEPVVADVATPRIRCVDAGPVRRVWLEVPPQETAPEYAAPGAEAYPELLADLLGEAATGSDVWLYTPMALHLAEALKPRMLVYDVMDDLSAFADATPDMPLAQRRALHRADLVFTGGRSLFQMAAAIRGAEDVHLFPSGVETQHYARSRAFRTPRSRPTAGYVGVIDERLDLKLIGDLSAQLPDWDFKIIGPVTKIDPATLPVAPNLFYPGMQPYDELPRVMAGLDVALMPFALNDATRAISPTKTLEYLAAGLPVVSTRVPDVVTDWGTVVHLADDGRGFADACRIVSQHSGLERDALVAPLAMRHEWDVISERMTELMLGAPLSQQAAMGTMPA
jgi:glycosyltransferase involved in cell wall biosynthesis